MAPVDWLIVILYFLLSASIGFYYTKRAGKDTQEFFLSGRSLPWWLAGTSMVATTFAADTPLAVTELVAKNGIAGNWIWWNFVFGGMLTIYLGIFMNCIIMGWVNLAMASILEGFFGIPRDQVLLYVAGALVITAIYSALAGLWGVAVTDAFQFVLAMAGTIVLAVVVLSLPQIGGMEGLTAKLPEWTLRFTPVIGEAESAADLGGIFAMSLAAFLAFVGVQWWASWYPGAEPGGGGYIAQRMMSAKDEKHSLFATLWFTIAHYCLRPWPWIIVGLASLVLYPELGAADRKLGYVYAMRDFLPVGLKGMLIAAFFAAYMSTIATQLNWGTSYVINDFYRRFINRSAQERHFVLVSRITTILIMLVSLGVTSALETISDAWAFIIEAGAGLGLVLILRWFWWRINAWSEISAMIAPLVAYGVLKLTTDVAFPETLYFIVATTTVVWLVVTFVTRPTDDATLDAFYRRVHPGGAGWKAVAARLPDVQSDTSFGVSLVNWIAGVVLVYSTLFGFGNLLLGATLTGAVLLGVAGLAAGFIYLNLSRAGFETIVK